MSMSERLYKIVRMVAYGELVAGEMVEECPHCTYERRYGDEEPIHTPDCIVPLARAEMKELGTPLKKYRVEYESAWRDYPSGSASSFQLPFAFAPELADTPFWQQQKGYEYAYDEQEARKDIPVMSKRKGSFPQVRNVYVECLGEVQ